jgi:hypothetical protein
LNVDVPKRSGRHLVLWETLALTLLKWEIIPGICLHVLLLHVTHNPYLFKPLLTGLLSQSNRLLDCIGSFWKGRLEQMEDRGHASLTRANLAYK